VKYPLRTIVVMMERRCKRCAEACIRARHALAARSTRLDLMSLPRMEHEIVPTPFLAGSLGPVLNGNAFPFVRELQRIAAIQARRGHLPCQESPGCLFAYKLLRFLARCETSSATRSITNY